MSKCNCCGLSAPDHSYCSQTIPAKYVHSYGTNFNDFYRDTCKKCPDIRCFKNTRRDLKVCPECHYVIGVKS